MHYDNECSHKDTIMRVCCEGLKFLDLALQNCTMPVIYNEAVVR